MHWKLVLSFVYHFMLVLLAFCGVPPCLTPPPCAHFWPPRPPFVPATPMAKQHQALVPSLLAPWKLAVRFSMGPTACDVCCVMPGV